MPNVGSGQGTVRRTSGAGSRTGGRGVRTGDRGGGGGGGRNKQLPGLVVPRAAQQRPESLGQAERRRSVGSIGARPASRGERPASRERRSKGSSFVAPAPGGPGVKKGAGRPPPPLGEAYMQKAGEGYSLEQLTAMAGMHLSAGRPDDALPMVMEVYGAHREINGAEHPDTLVHMTNLAQVHMKMLNEEEALPLFTEALIGQRRGLGSDHESTLITIATLGELVGLMGNHTAAIVLLEEGANGWTTLGGRDHPQAKKCMEQLQINSRFAQDPVLATNFKEFRALKKEGTQMAQAKRDALAAC